MFTYDMPEGLHVRRRAAGAGLSRTSCRAMPTCSTQLTRADHAQHPARQRRDGHGHRVGDGDRDGAGRRHRRHPPQPLDREQALEIEKVKKSESGMILDPVTVRSGSAHRRRARDHAALPHLRPAGDRRTASWSASSPTATCASRSGSTARSREVMTQGEPDHRPPGHRPRRGQGDPARQPHREAAHRRRARTACKGLITVKDIQKAAQFPNACKDHLGRLRVAGAIGTGEDRAAARRAPGARRRRRAGDRHRARPLRPTSSTRCKEIKAALSRRRCRRRQRRHRRRARAPWPKPAPTRSRSAWVRRRSAPRASSPASACRSSPPSPTAARIAQRLRHPADRRRRHQVLRRHHQGARRRRATR